MDITPLLKVGFRNYVYLLCDRYLLDHAAGVVIGETTVVGNNVSILHHVTLGETGKVGLGNMKICEGAKIGAGSLVLIDVPAWTTPDGNPVRLVGGKEHPKVHENVPSETMDHTSFIYVI